MNHQEIADRWAGEACTLNGEPAKVQGRKLPYGVVAPLDAAFGGVEFAWQTIDDVMRAGGRFVTSGHAARKPRAV